MRAFIVVVDRTRDSTPMGSTTNYISKIYEEHCKNNTFRIVERIIQIDYFFIKSYYIANKC